MKYDVIRPNRLWESLSKHYYFKITLKLKANNIYIKVNLYRVLLKTTRANLLEMACLECFTTYGASIGGFPSASFFFSWSTPSVWSRQVKYRFIFSGLTDGVSILIPKISAIVFWVCFCKPLLNEIVEFQPNKKRSWNGFLVIPLDSALIRLLDLLMQYRECQKMYQQSALTTWAF